MWIHLSDNWFHCFLGRQYPFTLDGIPELIQDKLPGEWEKFTNFHFRVINDEQGNHFNLGIDRIGLKTADGSYELYKNTLDTFLF